MIVKLGLLRSYINEAVSMTRTTSPSAPTDDDATVPGHLPNELPKSASLDEESWVPGRWDPTEGEPLDPRDADRIGDPTGDNGPDLDETDDRMIGDGMGPGIKDPEFTDGEGEISQHLRNNDVTCLGSPPEEKPKAGFYGERLERESDWLSKEIQRFMKQKRFRIQESPVGAGMVDPLKPPHGFYSDFDAAKDHGDGSYIQGTWYRSPGRPAGGDGDPFRGDDPYKQLGFHSPKGPTDGTTPPAASGEKGVAARKTPEIWSLNAGSNTGEVLGANKPKGTEGSEDVNGGSDNEDESFVEEPSDDENSEQETKDNEE